MLRYLAILFLALTTAFSQAVPAPASNVLMTNRGVPERFFAKGDGVADDSIPLRNAIAAAGVKGTVELTRNKVYRITGPLVPLSGQTWIMHGATIKRCNAITDTTATNIGTGAGSTNITVTNGAQWKVGMSIAVYNGGTYDPHNHTINAINGNVLTVGTAFTVGFASGGTVVSSFTMINAVSVPDLTILGGELDGNRANNTGLTKWDLHNEIYAGGCDRLLIEKTYVHDAQSEGIQYGGVGAKVTRCTVLNTNGNGIHFSGSSGGVASHNFVKNTNLAGATPGHVDGGIIFSDTTGDSFILNNYVENAVAGIGSIDTDDNSSVAIEGNILKNCTSYAIEGVFPTVSGGKVTILGNHIYNCVQLRIQNTGSMSGGVGPYNWIVEGNIMEDTTIYVQRAFNITIKGNQLKSPANTSGTGIFLFDVKVATVSLNQVLGYGYGIYVDGSGGSLIESNNIIGNTVKNQYIGGLWVADATSRNVTFQANEVQTDAAYAGASYAGITLKNNTYAINNTMDLQSGLYGILCPNGGASTNGAIVNGNIIRSANLTASIRCAGGSQNNWLVNNFTQQAISDAGTNTKTGNVTIF